MLAIQNSSRGAAYGIADQNLVIRSACTWEYVSKVIMSAAIVPPESIYASGGLLIRQLK